MNDELLQCFDEARNPTELRPKSEIKKNPPRWWYAVARVWLVNDRGQLMCSKRSETVANPGKWQTYFGGHVAAGESILQTAKRELREETGLDFPINDFFLVEIGRVDEKKVHYEAYVVRFNGQPSDLRFDDNETTEARWTDMNEYNQDQADNPDRWCNSCKTAQQKKILEWLKLT